MYWKKWNIYKYQQFSYEVFVTTPEISLAMAWPGLVILLSYKEVVPNFAPHFAGHVGFGISILHGFIWRELHRKTYGQPIKSFMILVKLHRCCKKSKEIFGWGWFYPPSTIKFWGIINSTLSSYVLIFNTTRHHPSWSLEVLKNPMWPFFQNPKSKSWSNHTNYTNSSNHSQIMYNPWF